MRFKEFKKKISEATLSASTPTSIPGYINKLNQKLAANQLIAIGANGDEQLQPDSKQKVSNLTDKITGKINNVNTEKSVGQVYKSNDFKASSSDIEGNTKVFNLGNATEGMLATAIFKRLTSNQDLTMSEFSNALTSLPMHNPAGVNVGPIKIKDANNKIDQIQLHIKLDKSSYEGITNVESLKNLTGHVTSIVNYVNQEEIKTLRNEFENNRNVDSVKVIADGVTDAKNSKVDVEVIYATAQGNKKTVRYERSVKTGGVKQFGQVTTGGAKDEDEKETSITREGRYDLQEEFWDDFGIDISASEDDFNDVENFIKAYDFTYAEAAKQLNLKLKGDNNAKEKQMVKRIFDIIKKHGRGDRPNAKTVDFGPKGYKILDYEKLNQFLKNTDLTAKFEVGSKRPTVSIQDQSGKDFLIIRLYVTDKKITNMIERGPALEKIVKVKEG